MPTLAEFSTRFLEGYATANRQKASTIASKERILRVHLLPPLGKKRLDAITNENVAQLKASLARFAAKTANNVLNVLSKLLNFAVEWGVIERSPCTVTLLRSNAPTIPFYEEAAFGRLVEGAAKSDIRVLVMVLLAGDAGLRRGEIISLRQNDVDLPRLQIEVRFTSWQGVEDSPNGGRSRVVDTTDALQKALTANRHLRGERVPHQDDGEQVDENKLQRWMETATRRAGLDVTRSLHILRHTFCSRLAMRGAPAKAIQELAGHRSLSTTLRSTHPSPSARRYRPAQRGSGGLRSWSHCGDGADGERERLEN